MSRHDNIQIHQFPQLQMKMLQYRLLYPLNPLLDIISIVPYPAGAVVECVVVDGASLPVLDL